MSFVREHRDRFGVEPVLRVLLLSAYACLPERGSEPGIGCMVLLMAARHHDMWLRTQPHMAEELEAWSSRGEWCNSIGGRM